MMEAVALKKFSPPETGGEEVSGASICIDEGWTGTNIYKS